METVTGTAARAFDKREGDSMEDKYQMFCDAVLAACPRATKEEREEIRRELLDHLEDHALELQGRNWSEEEAREKAVTAMGDASEIGKAWNDQLSPFWQKVDWAAKVALAVAIIFLGWAVVDQTMGIAENIMVQYLSLWKISPGFSSFQEPVARWAVNEKVDMGEFRLWVCEGSLFAENEAICFDDKMEEGQYELVLYAVAYSKNPLHPGPIGIVDGLDDRWVVRGDDSDGHLVSPRLYTLVEKGQPSVTLSLENRHGSFTWEVPLKWGDEDAQ